MPQRKCVSEEDDENKETVEKLRMSGKCNKSRFKNLHLHRNRVKKVILNIAFVLYCHVQQKNNLK